MINSAIDIRLRELKDVITQLNKTIDSQNSTIEQPFGEFSSSCHSRQEELVI